jgi:hypothetical protein
LAHGGHGVAMFRAREELRQQKLAHGTFQQCQTGLRPPPDERDRQDEREAILSYEGETD